MNVFVEMALGWLVLGSLVAVAVLAEHFRAAARFPRKAGWWLIAAIIVWWPWPVWVWCATQTETETPRTAPIALTTFVFIGALGLGWGGWIEAVRLPLPQRT